MHLTIKETERVFFILRKDDFRETAGPEYLLMSEDSQHETQERNLER